MSFAMFCMQFISCVRCTRAAGNHEFLNQQQEKVPSKQTMLNHLMTRTTHTIFPRSEHTHRVEKKQIAASFFPLSVDLSIVRSCIARSLAFSSAIDSGVRCRSLRIRFPHPEICAPKCGNAFFVPSRRVRRLCSCCFRLNIAQQHLFTYSENEILCKYLSNLFQF